LFEMALVGRKEGTMKSKVKSSERGGMCQNGKEKNKKKKDEELWPKKKHGGVPSIVPVTTGRRMDRGEDASGTLANKNWRKGGDVEDSETEGKRKAMKRKKNKKKSKKTHTTKQNQPTQNPNNNTAPTPKAIQQSHSTAVGHFPASRIPKENGEPKRPPHHQTN